MPTYDANKFDPPAPIAHVTLRHPETNKAWASVPMLIDTGADITLVPQTALTQLNLTSPDAQYELIGFGGTSTMAPAVQLKMSFLGHTFQGVFLLTEHDMGILGRNVLNALALTFDGPNLKWHKVLVKNIK